MKIPVALCLLITGAAAQVQPDEQPAPPKATPVDPALQPDAGEDWYQHGRNVYESAKQNPDIDGKLAGYAAAIDVFTRYLNEYGSNQNAEGAWWYLGQAYYASGRIDDAKRCFTALLNRFGKGRYAAEAAYTLGADHFNRHQYALAAEYFKKLAEISTKPEQRQRGLFYTGICFDQQGRSSEASTYFEKVIADEEAGNPYRTRAQFSQGRILARGDKLPEALKLLDEVVQSPSAADLRGQAAVQAGAIAAKLGQDDASDKYLMLVLNTPGMEASRADAQLNLMAARFGQKRYQDVINFYRQSVEKAAGEKEASRLMIAAKSYMMLGNNVEALDLFRQVERMGLSNDTFSFEASYLRLMCFFKIEGRHVPEQVDAFLELYQKGHAKDERIHTALLMKAESLMSERKTAEAAKVYAEIDVSLVAPSNRSGFLYNRAWCMAESEDPQGAIRSFTAFIDGYPNDEKVPKALVQRAKAYADTGEFAKSLADYDRLIARKDDPELRAVAWMRSAEISKQQGNLEDMVTRYRSFLENADKPTDEQKAKANYWLAWGLVKLDKVEPALPYAIAARKLDPKRYAKNAGQLLCLGYGSLQQPERLGDELDEAIKGAYASELPEQLIRWAALQAFNAGRFKQAARFYELIADDADPEATLQDVWRYYGKSLLEAGEPKKALAAVEHALANEDNQQWKADGLLDKSKALAKMGDDDAALKVIDEGLALHPQGRVGFGLNILRGDIHVKKGQIRDALAAYAGPGELMDDSDPGKPAVLQKIINALEVTKDEDMPQRQETLQRYRKMMDRFPDWKPETGSKE